MSTVSDALKERTKAAMKARDEVAKNIYRVVLGELQTAEARAGGPVDDAAAHKVIKKIVASNEATLEVARDEATKAQLARENALLMELVPQAWTVDQIVDALAPVREAIQGAKADGPAMGLAMKQLKSVSAPVESADVKAAITQIRS